MYYDADHLMWNYFYSLTPIVAVAITCIDPWVIEFMVSHTTGSNQWENGISNDFNVRGLSEKWNPAINNDFTVFVRDSTRKDRNHIFLQNDIFFFQFCMSLSNISKY